VRRALHILLACALPVLPAAAATPVAVPSGQVLYLQEILWQEDTLRLRFVAPGIAREGGTLGFEDVQQDFQALCETMGLQLLRETGRTVDQLVVSMADRPLAFGETAPDTRQFFEAFRIENGACVLEVF